MPPLLRALRTSLQAQPLTGASVLAYLGGGLSSSGVEVGPDTAMRSMAAWRAITLTSGTVASLPLKVYRDVVSDDGIPYRLEQQNQLFLDPMHAELDITWFEGVEYIVSCLMRYGNAYALKIRNEGGSRIVRLLPLRPDQVRCYRQAKTIDEVGLAVGGQPRKWFEVKGIDLPLTADDVLHIPGFSLDGICGQSPIDVAREAIGIGLAAEKVAALMYDSGLLAGGFLQPEESITDKQAASAKQRWREKVGGVTRSFEVAVLSNGWKFTPNQIPPREAQFLESRQFSVAEIGRLYGVPPALLYEYMATGNVDADKLGAQWMRFSLGQLLARIEDRLSLHLLPRGTFCEFNAAGLLRGTPKEEAELMKIQIDSRTLTINEARAVLNRPPLSDAELAPPAVPAPAVPDPEVATNGG